MLMGELDHTFATASNPAGAALCGCGWASRLHLRSLTFDTADFQTITESALKLFDERVDSINFEKRTKTTGDTLSEWTAKAHCNTYPTPSEWDEPERLSRAPDTLLFRRHFVVMTLRMVCR
jgi:hypothetical protein